MNSVSAVLIYLFIYLFYYLFLLTMDVQVQGPSTFSELQLNYTLNDFCLASHFAAVQMRLTATVQSFCLLSAELRDLC